MNRGSVLTVKETKQNENFGVDFCLQDAVETDKHLILAIENTRVIKITESKSSGAGKGSNVLLQSESQPEIFYLYRQLQEHDLPVLPIPLQFCCSRAVEMHTS